MFRRLPTAAIANYIGGFKRRSIIPNVAAENGGAQTGGTKAALHHAPARPKIKSRPTISPERLHLLLGLQVCRMYIIVTDLCRSFAHEFGGLLS